MQQTLSLDSVIEMGRRGDPVQFIGVASTVLEQGVACDDLRLLLMQRLVGRGLIYRARACAEGLSDAVRSHPEFSGMRRTLSATTNNGLIPQSSLSPCFNLNLAALRRRYAWVDQVATTWEAQRHHIEFHATSDGQRQVYDRRGHPGGGWRPVFGDHTPNPPVDELRSQLQNQLKRRWLKNWLAMLTLLKGRVMPKYVAGKDYKSRTDRIFNPSNSDYMSKKRVVEKVTKILRGENRRIKLEKAFRKLSVEELVMLGMLVERAIKKEVEVRKQTDE